MRSTWGCGPSVPSPGPLAPRAQARVSVEIDKSQHESSSQVPVDLHTFCGTNQWLAKAAGMDGLHDGQGAMAPVGPQGSITNTARGRRPGRTHVG
jgi:hypothetical protein